MKHRSKIQHSSILSQERKLKHTAKGVDPAPAAIESAGGGAARQRRANRAVVHQATNQTPEKKEKKHNLTGSRRLSTPQRTPGTKWFKSAQLDTTVRPDPCISISM